VLFIGPPFGFIDFREDEYTGLMTGLLVLLGAAAFVSLNNYRAVEASDRRILVLDSGKLIMSDPRSLVRAPPRSTCIGPTSGLSGIAPMCSTRSRASRSGSKRTSPKRPAGPGSVLGRCLRMDASPATAPS